MRRMRRWGVWSALAIVAVLFFGTGSAVARDLRIATWNLEWLTLRPAGDRELPRGVVPRTPADFAALRGYARALDADVVAVEEVDGRRPAAEVFPPGRYNLYFTHDPVVQRVGFAVRKDIPVTVNPDVTALRAHDRWLRSGADITIRWQGHVLRLLAVHLKTGCLWSPLTDRRRRACPVLGEQLRTLDGWVAARQAEGVPFAVLGDFNRSFDARDQFSRALARAAPLAFAGQGMESPCWGGERFIDHILVGGPARAWLVPDSLHVLVYRETDREARRQLSDHCPVSVELRP